MPRFDPVSPYPTLRAKAVALFERTFRMASGSSTKANHGLPFLSMMAHDDPPFSVSVKTNMYWADHRALQMSLSQFALNLPPLVLNAGVGMAPLDELDLLTIHTLVHVSTIYLHRDLSDTTPTSYEKCVVAANTVTSYLRQLNENHYPYLDPISSVRLFSHLSPSGTDC